MNSTSSPTKKVSFDEKTLGTKQQPDSVALMFQEKAKLFADLKREIKEAYNKG